MDEQEKYAAAPYDGTVERFLRGVAVAIHGRGLLRFTVSPTVWQVLMYETNYGAVPGTRFVNERFELCTPDGYIPVLVEAHEQHAGRAVFHESMATLDFASVVE